MALDSDDKAQVKDNSEEEAADRMDGGNGLYNNFVVAADKGDGGGDSRAKEAPGYVRMFLGRNNRNRARLRNMRGRRRRKKTPPSFTRTSTAVMTFSLSSVTCNFTNFS